MRDFKYKYVWWRRLLKSMVRERKLTPIERMSSRIGYMGSGFLMVGQWTLEPILFLSGLSYVMIQVLVRKQWNLVALYINGLTAWTMHLLNG